MNVCKDCKRYVGDCGNHNIDRHGHIDYENPCVDQLKLSVTDVSLCFVEKESTKSIIKRNLKIKTLLKEYEPSIIREAYWRLYGDQKDET